MYCILVCVGHTLFLLKCTNRTCWLRTSCPHVIRRIRWKITVPGNFFRSSRGSSLSEGKVSPLVLCSHYEAVNEVTVPQRVVGVARAHRASFTVALDELADSCRKPHGAVETNYQTRTRPGSFQPEGLTLLVPMRPKFKERKDTKGTKRSKTKSRHWG